MALMHLAECEPETKGWEETTYTAALAAGGRFCPSTQYMTDEMFADELVWIEPDGRYGDWMLTRTGQVFYPLDPRLVEIHPYDIGHALGMICRFGGHVSDFYSVAEHSVLMSHAVSPANALWALLHDATEAYLNDLIRPLKRHLPEYVRIEQHLMTAIAVQFHLPGACPAEVKTADNRILVDERAALLPPYTRPWKSTENVPALGVPISGWSPTEARRRFLDRYTELTGEVVNEPVA